jgi:hypothetical protein
MTLEEDLKFLSEHRIAQIPLNHAVHYFIDITEDFESPRAPGWYEAVCSCGQWSTTGNESVVESGAYEHVVNAHGYLVQMFVRATAEAVRYHRKPGEVSHVSGTSPSPEEGGQRTG